MKVEYINPFIESVHDLFVTMLACKATRGQIAVTSACANPRDITALIGVSGDARGIVALSFPVKTALSMASRMLGDKQKLVVVDDTVSDAVAELVNIVAGGAKARFCNGDSKPLDLSLPTVVRGNSYSVDYPSHSTWIDVPFDSELGEFNLRVAFSQNHRNKIGATR